MERKRYSADEIIRRGEELYGERFRPLLEPKDVGKYLILDIETGDYEIDADQVAALNRAMARHPEGVRSIKRIGFPIRLGGRFAVQRP